MKGSSGVDLHSAYLRPGLNAGRVGHVNNWSAVQLNRKDVVLVLFESCLAFFYLLTCADLNCFVPRSVLERMQFGFFENHPKGIFRKPSRHISQTAPSWGWTLKQFKVQQDREDEIWKKSKCSRSKNKMLTRRWKSDRDFWFTLPTHLWFLLHAPYAHHIFQKVRRKHSRK